MKLTILATSDIHGYLYPTDYLNDTAELPFGLFKAASILEEEKAKAEGAVLLIENGDFIQGSPLSQYVEENQKTPTEIVSALNDIDFDVGIIGNHEFNYGLEYLKESIEVANHPVLSANIVKDDGNYFADAPIKIIEKEGLKIGVLGLTTQYIPHWEHPENISGLNFLSAVETAKNWVPKLQEEADVVVVAYHGGFEADLITGEPTERLTGENEAYQLIKEVPGIDALITGHQHREIATFVNDVPVIQPGYRGENIGKITLEFKQVADKLQIVNKNVDLLSVAKGEVLEKLAKKYEPLAQAVNGWLDQVIGQTSNDMRIKNAHDARIVEHPYIEFINRVQLYYGKADISGTALFSDTVSGYGKDITVRDVILNYPFPNTLAVINVSGAELKAALEQSAEYFTLGSQNEIIVNPKFITPKPQPYNYDMYEGIDYTIDVSKPVGERITKLQFKNKVVHPKDEFELVTNQYRAVGGGNFSMFAGKNFVREINTPMSDLITEYIKEKKIIDAEVNHNFQVISEK